MSVLPQPQAQRSVTPHPCLAPEGPRILAGGKLGAAPGYAPTIPRALHYPGHIGYNVAPKYRGHRYAARSCQLLLPLAHAHGSPAVWLTVNPENTPSLKTCQLIDARYVETVRIPCDHEMYQDGSRYCRRHRLSLRKLPLNQ